MKIIICTRDLTSGGVGTYIQGLLREFDNNKKVEKVVVVGPEKINGFSTKIKFKILKKFGKYFITKEPFFASRCSKEIKKILKEESFDVIYTRFPMLLSPNIKVPLIPIFPMLHKSIAKSIKMAGLKFKIAKFFHNLYSYFDYKTIERAKKVVFVSKKTLNEAKEYFPKFKHKFVHIPTMVDTNYFFRYNKTRIKDTKKKLGLNKDKKYLLFVGRLEPLKGIDDVLKIIEEIKREIDVEFLVIGDGLLREKIENSNSIRYLGKIENKKLNDYYNVADLFVFPSYYDNSPLSILEAMATGTPILSNNVGDVKDMIGENIMISDFRDKNKIINKIINMLSLNKKESRISSNKLIKRINSIYSKKIISKKILEISNGK